MRPSILCAAAAALLAGNAMAKGAEQILLGGPEIAKVTWDTRGLRSADFDGDGRLDAALINNDNAKIVLLYQRTPGEVAKSQRRAVSRNRWEPEVEDSRFEKVSIPTEQRHLALAAADFDGNGRPDLALTGVEDALTVKFQAEDGTFAKSWRWKDFEPSASTEGMIAADLNGDKRADLAVLGKGKLLVFLQGAAGGFTEPTVYLTGEDRTGQIFAEDADGDGSTDLLYIAGSGEGTIRLRRQTAPGVFSAEIALPYTIPAYAAVASRDAGGRLMLTRVNAKSNLIERHAFTTGAPEAGGAMLPTIYNMPAGMKVAAHAIGDFNGDGRDDVVVGDSKAAQVALFIQQADGSFGEPRIFPSFTGITGLAAISPASGKAATLAVVSRKEGFGVSRLTADGRLEFPSTVALKGEPVSVIATEGRAVVLVEEERKWRIEQFTSADGKAWAGAGSKALAALKREPSGLAVGDLNGDKRADLLVMVPREPALILTGGADGLLAEPLKETANMRSQLADLSAERTTIVDIDGDGRAEILTTATGYARSIRLSPGDADVAVVDQYNARQPGDKLAIPAFLDVDGDGSNELVFAEAGTAFFQTLKKEKDGVYRSAKRLEGIAGEMVAALPAKLGTANESHLLVVGRDRFWTAPFGGNRPKLELVSSYDTDLQNCDYYTAAPADLNGDGKEEIVAFDKTSHLLEVLSPGATGAQPWKSLMHFVLFEENIRFRGRKGDTAVREMLFRDFTGDGRTDILLLVHDRILLFPQG